MQAITDIQILSSVHAAPSTLGRYKVVQETAHGGMSVVYEARHTETGRTVAVKMLTMPPGLPPEQAQEMRARFERESRAMAGLSHPNIVSIYEVGEQEGQLFLVMEYLRGETLRDRLGRGSLTPTQALLVLRQVADALDAVHAQGVVHRDIKPSNVMLLLDGTVKLLDFGIARQSDDATITSTGALIGSPAYMAPEQVQGGAGTPISDLWALGALLYEMLAGHPPFTGKNIPAVLYKVIYENPPPIAGLTTPVQRVLRRALDKNPARRYPSARALAESLARAASPSSIYAQRQRRQWAAVTLMVILCVGMAVLYQRPVVIPRALNVVSADVFPVQGSRPIADTPRPGIAPEPGTLRAAEHRSRRHHDRHRKHRAHGSTLKPRVWTRRPAAKPLALASRTARRIPAFARRMIPRQSIRATRISHVASVSAVREASPRRVVPASAPEAGHVLRTALIRLSDSIASHTVRRAAAFRRIAPLPRQVVREPAMRDPPPRPPKSAGFDREESLQLQKFIWPVGR